jgi:hypothetical protein
MANGLQRELLAHFHFSWVDSLYSTPRTSIWI